MAPLHAPTFPPHAGSPTLGQQHPEMGASQRSCGVSGCLRSRINGGADPVSALNECYHLCVVVFASTLPYQRCHRFTCVGRSGVGSVRAQAGELHCYA